MADLDTSGIDPELLENPLFQALMADGLAIRDRFSVEPIHAKTGKGSLKTAGVDEITAVKKAEEPNQESASEFH